MTQDTMYLNGVNLMLEAMLLLPGKKPVPTLPGNQTLIAGDAQLGWYGETTTTDLIDGATLATVLALPNGTGNGVDTNSYAPWLKFAYNGKILYVAKQTYRSSITLTTLRNANVVYGTKTIVIKGVTYKVRLLTGTDGGGETVAGGEWNDLMYRVAAGTQIPAGSKWANYTAAEMSYGSGTGFINWCQEHRASAPLIYITRGNGSITAINAYTEATATAVVGWRPVLEPV